MHGRRLTCSCCSPPRPSDRSQQALRPKPHQQQKDDAVDQDAVFRRDPENLGQTDQRHRTCDRTGDVAQSPQDHDGQRQDGLLRVESLVIDVGIQMGGDAAADARSEPAENERQCLIAIEAETIGARRNIVIANGAKTAADMRTEQPHLQKREQNHDREAEPVDRCHADKFKTK